MDPNANLKEALELVDKMFATQDGPNWELGPDHDDCFRLCELVESLNQWMTQGGFMPAQWMERR